MAEDAKPKRLTDMFLGKLAACLLFVLWLVSMCMFDSNACTSFPLVVGMGVIALLALSCLAAGGRVVRFTWLNWVSLLIGGYFLVRCLCSYSVVESWRESIIIVGCFIFYVAGILAAQSRSASWMVWVIVIAAALNLAAFYNLRDPSVPIEWTGRPAVGFMGANNKPVSLLIYKNFAGAFFALLAAWLLCCCLWCEMRRWVKFAMLLLLGVTLYASLHCHTRDVFALYPILAVVVWFLHVANCLYQDRKLGFAVVITGALFLCAVCIALYELIFSGELYAFISSVDTHCRGLVWKCICRLAPDAPVFGFGVSASQWEIAPYFNEWTLPNYAHNEYLQAWMDYGLIGLGCTFFVLVFHVVYAFRTLSSEHVEQARRIGSALSLLAVFVMAVCAIVDFPWHSYAFASLTAFCCGIMGSPAPVEPLLWRRSLRSPARVRSASYWGRGLAALLCVGCMGWCAVMGKVLYKPWQKQWAFARLSDAVDEDASQRHALLAELLPEYPSPALMDRYYILSVKGIEWSELERLLKIALAGNPKQIFMANMLCDALDGQGKFEESEKIFREMYVGDGMGYSMLSNWPAYYAAHLLLWGRSEVNRGHVGKAYSLLDYALNIHAHSSVDFSTRFGRSEAPWQKEDGIKPWVQDALVAAHLDASAMLRAGVQKDDSWQQPFADGGKYALYTRWGNDSSRRDGNKFKWMKFSDPDKKNVN